MERRLAAILATDVVGYRDPVFRPVTVPSARRCLMDRRSQALDSFAGRLGAAWVLAGS